MKKALLSLTLGLGLLASTPAEAAYGPAGCGWGNQFFDKDGTATGVKGLITVWINMIAYNQMISILLKMGTCGDGSANIDYIEDNATQLAFDFSQGQGESVSTLATMLECEENSLIEYGQSNYEALFTNSEDLTVGLLQYASTECGNL